MRLLLVLLLQVATDGLFAPVPHAARGDADRASEGASRARPSIKTGARPSNKTGVEPTWDSLRYKAAVEALRKTERKRRLQAPPVEPPLALPAKCPDIFDPDEWIPFVGGLAKGVTIGRYSPLYNIQFIGCRGDQNGDKTDYIEKTEPGLPAPAPQALYVESCDPASFFCENRTDIFPGGRREALVFGTKLGPPFTPLEKTSGTRPGDAFQQAYMCEGVDSLEDCAGPPFAADLDPELGGEAPCCSAPGGKCSSPASGTLASILCTALGYQTGNIKSSLVRPST
jgi:hypothetical protein